MSILQPMVYANLFQNILIHSHLLFLQNYNNNMSYIYEATNLALIQMKFVEAIFSEYIAWFARLTLKHSKSVTFKVC